MSRQLWSDAGIAPIPIKRTTALLLVDNQYGFRNIAAFGTSVSNSNHEENTAKLLEAFRKTSSLPQGQRPLVIHAQHRAPWSDSPVFPGHEGPYGLDGETRRGVDWAEYSRPRLWNEEQKQYFFVEQFHEAKVDTGSVPSEQDETFLTSHGHSLFINAHLQTILNKHAIKTLIIAGMPLEYAVSTAVRTAQNLALTGHWGGRGNMEDVDFAKVWTDGEGVYLEAAEKTDENGGFDVDMPRIILVEDAVRAFGKEGLPAEVVHAVHVDSLKHFAEVRKTDDIISALKAV